MSFCRIRWNLVLWDGRLGVVQLSICGDLLNFGEILMIYVIGKSRWFFTVIVGLALIGVLVLVRLGTERPETRKLFNVPNASTSDPVVSFSPDDRLLAFLNLEKFEIEVRTLPDNRFVQKFAYSEEIYPYAIAFSSNSHQLAISTEDAIEIWDIDNSQSPVAILIDHEEQSGGTMAFSPDNLRLAQLSQFTLKIWNLASGEIETRSTLRGNISAHNMSFSPDGRFIAINNGYLYVWDIEKGEAVLRINEPTLNFTFSADSNQLISTGNSQVFHWQLPEGDLINHFNIGKQAMTSPASPESGEIIGFLFSETGISRTDDPFGWYRVDLTRWRIEDGVMLSSESLGAVDLLDFGRSISSPSGKWLALLGIGNGIHVWKVGE